jgi:hypothetical protein
MEIGVFCRFSDRFSAVTMTSESPDSPPASAEVAPPAAASAAQVDDAPPKAMTRADRATLPNAARRRLC